MNLYLLRHAIAMESGWRPGASDAERPLSPEGKKKMRKIALGMKRLELSFDLILSSPYVRAQETAAIVVEELTAACGVQLTPHLEVGGNPAELMEEVAALGKGKESILLVGHEPQLSKLISYLLAGNSGLAITMKKGGLCKLDLARLRYARTGTLEWLLTPSQLVHLAP